uniref:Par-3 family cell polarity regulator beta b n=1 Tax=Tetraodon nigroviridis TaxID=99883 RepID=H3DI39_TETNG
MKVTVTFGQTGVVVPCKEGWTVRDLIQQATQRYRKLLEQKKPSYWVSFPDLTHTESCLKSHSDGHCCVESQSTEAEAMYRSREPSRRGLDNTSLSASPDLYQYELSAFQPITGGEIEVNSSALKSNTPLLVRSSSDSAISPQQMEPEASPSEDSAGMKHTINKTCDVTKTEGNQCLAWEHYLLFEERGRIPVVVTESLTRTVEILGEDSPLGIHVVPYCSSLSGRSLGLYIRGVEEESRSRKEGLFQEDECIIKINNTDLMDKTFSQAQEVFRQAMHSPVVHLEVVPSATRERYEKSLIGQLFGNGIGPDASPRVTKAKDPPPPIKAKPTFRPSESPAIRMAEEVAAMETALSIKSPKDRSESPLLRKNPALSCLVSSKKGGRRLRIDLKKGSEGLGFTVVTRDSTLHGSGPILVKNILPRGAAVKDGRLQSGDRILEVNGMDVTGVSQEELVCMLRSTRQGESVCLVVLRQEDMFLPREMKDEVSCLPVFVPENGKEQLTFEVPLNDSGSAGLGISLKGNKSRETGEDLGIFIKSIIHGGAAYKDGRLCVNDQLVAVNGESLLGSSNHQAMETLRRSMSQEGNARGTIQLVVLRVVKAESCQDFLFQDQSPNRSFDGSSGLSGLYRRAGRLVRLRSSCSPQQPVNGLCVYLCVHTEEDEEPELNYHGAEMNNVYSYIHKKDSNSSCSAQPQTPGEKQWQLQHVKASKSMDLVADESNIGSLGKDTIAPPPALELGPTLGLKKSSSLESLQTAMSEVNRNNELLPFHRPRQNMVRGRGCNESFRAAIDKSYDGPPEDE